MHAVHACKTYKLLVAKLYVVINRNIESGDSKT